MAQNTKTVEDLLKNSEALTAALNSILEYVTPLVENSPETPEWSEYCPEDTLYSGNYDDAWKEGQDNGEAYAAHRIQPILDKALES